MYNWVIFMKYNILNAWKLWCCRLIKIFYVFLNPLYHKTAKHDWQFNGAIRKSKKDCIIIYIYNVYKFTFMLCHELWKCVLSLFSFSFVAVNLCVISEVVVSHVEFRYSLMKWAVVEDVENWPMYWALWYIVGYGTNCSI